jgi:hypothetical protein
MRPEALVLSGDSPGLIDQHLAALLGHAGVRVRHAPISRAPELLGRRVDGGRRLVAVNVTAAAGLLGDEVLKVLQPIYGIQGIRVFLYGLGEGAAVRHLLATLTRGAVLGCTSLRDESCTYRVTDKFPDACGALSGLSFGPVRTGHDYALECAENVDGLAALVRVNQRPLFARLEAAGCVLYAVGTDRLLGLDEPFGDLDEIARFSQYIPVMMLLRDMFGDEIWHPTGRFAAVVIDDPPLVPKFGYLDFAQLLAQTDRDGFAVSVAFIPFNRWRTRRATADLFVRRPDRLSLCIHGCDHTSREFGIRDLAALREMAYAARQRMDSHRLRSGVNYDDVMVFPQGVFSEEAVRAIDDCGFLATANSTLSAADDGREFAAGEVLVPAMTRYSAFPVFKRRYPRDAHLFTMDAFLGRPVLPVLHPPDFKDGYEILGLIAAQVNGLAESVRWCGLGEIARSLHIVRRVGPGRMHVRALASTVLLVNDSAETRTYVVMRAESRASVNVRGATGNEIPFRRIGSAVFFCVGLLPGTQETVRISSDGAPAVGELRHPIRVRTRILARRLLSEVRDRYLVRSWPIYLAAKKRTGRQPSSRG